MADPQPHSSVPDTQSGTAPPDAVCVFEWDCASDQLHVSPGYAALVGGLVGPPPYPGSAVLARLAPLDRARLVALRQGLTPTAPAYRTQWHVSLPDGTEDLVQEQACGFFTDHGQLVRLVGSISRAPARERLAATLPVGERLYRAIGESIDYGVWVCAPDGRNIYASDSFLAMAGITQEQCSDFGWGSVLDPEDAERTITAWQECVRTGGTWDIEHRFRGVDGQWHDVLARGVPVHDEHGRLACWAGINLDISRLKRTEQALREAEDFSRAILDAVSTQVAVLDRSGTIVAVNEPWRQFAIENSGRAGQPPRTGVGTNYLEICRTARGDGADVALTVHDGILAVLERRTDRFAFEYPCHAPDRKRWFLLTTTAFAGAHGGAVVSHTDITAPMELSERLKAAHERLALAQESAGAGVWDWDMQTGTLEWSEQLFRLFGLDPAHSQPSFDAWRGILYPDDRAAAERLVADAVRNHQPLSSEYRIVLPSGDLRWIHALGRTTNDEAGRPVRMSGICLDISQRKRAEQQLFATTQRLQALMEALPVGVSFSDDPACHRIMGNAALLAQFEVTPADNVSASASDPSAAGRRIRYLQNGRELSSNDLPLQRAAAEGQVIAPMELEVELPSGRHWFAEASGAPLCDAQGHVIGGVAVVMDVTQRKRAEAALHEADRRKDEFLAMLAHELRNPLTPIRNAVHILERLELPDPRLQWVREVIQDQAVHLARLVDDLLDVSRIVRGKISLQRETLDLAAVVRRAVAAVSPTVERKGHRLRVRLPEDDVRLEADPVRLTQILVNLLDNAAKFTADGGQIDLSARLAGEELEIRVRDDGCGIPQALLPYVFDLFHQGEEGLDRASGGLGIGLTLVQRLVGLHGGRVEATSAGAGCGSTFTLTLPVGKPAGATSGYPTPAPPQASARLRVLVVDDDPAVADSTALWLEMEGYEPRVARSGPAALEEASVFQPQVVLLDIGLAGMDGYEVAQRLRTISGGNDMLLVAITGYGHEAAVARCRAAGFDHHLVKPFDPRGLLALLAARGLR